MQLMTTAYKSLSAYELPKQQVDVVPADFQAWNTQYQYRTTYRDMSKRKPAKPKKAVIPGYSGYIPGVIADNHFGKRVTQLAKEEFNREKFMPERTTEYFPERPLSSDGRTLGRLGGGLEDEYHTVSRFHGKTTIPVPHPNFGETKWETTTQLAYTPPEESRGRVHRTTDLEQWKMTKPTARPRAFSSGFAVNSTLFDGFGWRPMKHLHGDMRPTEYRNRFNMYLPFHPKPLKANLRKMKRKSLVY